MFCKFPDYFSNVKIIISITMIGTAYNGMDTEILTNQRPYISPG